MSAPAGLLGLGWIVARMVLSSARRALARTRIDASLVPFLALRPIRVGDSVDIAGTSGAVTEVGLFATTLDTPDNLRIIVPNSSIWGQTIKNFGTGEKRRLDLVIGVSYLDDLQLAASVLAKLLVDQPLVLKDPAPEVAVSELASSSVNFVVCPWCRKEDDWTLRFEVLERAKTGLEAAGCSIPIPQRDVHLDPRTNGAHV